MAYTNMYGSLLDAESYFGTRLNADAWLNADQVDQNKALLTATRLIERLNFNGTKTDPAQVLEFPRGGDQTVPQDILIACYEIALALLDGVDPDMEIDILDATSFGIGSARLTRDPNRVVDSIVSGIPSKIAWNYLRPYLRDSRSVRLSKI